MSNYYNCMMILLDISSVFVLFFGFDRILEDILSNIIIEQMEKDMSSWECIARYNLVDTSWFMYAYSIIFVILFAHKQRLVATIFACILLFLTTFSITGCMSSIGAFTTITIPNWEVIIVSYVLLLCISFINIDNIYVNYLVMIIPIYILFGCGLFYKIMWWLYPSPVQVVKIGNVDVRGKSQEEIDKLLKQAIVRV